MAVALPYLAVAATVTSGVLAYSQAQKQAGAMDLQADLYRAQAQREADALAIQIDQAQLEQQAEENRLRDEAIERRQRAFRYQQSLFASAAGRGIVAQPMGSLGALIDDAEYDLYQDLEAGRLERDFAMASYLTEAAGLTAAQAGALETGRYQAAAAELGADVTRLGAVAQLGSSLIGAHEIWPSSSES